MEKDHPRMFYALLPSSTYIGPFVLALVEIKATLKSWSPCKATLISN